jgi:hypothetical protein
MPLLRDLSEHLQTFLENNATPLSPDARRLTGDFERLLSYLAEDQPWLSQADNLRNRAHFADSVRAIHETLTAIQLRARSEAMPDWPGALVTHWQETKADVITFNYDTLVEAAYTAVANPSGDIERHRPPSDLYRLPVTHFRARAGDALIGAGRVSAFALLKLHGSLSWYYSGPDAAPSDVVYNTDDVWGWRLEADARVPRDEDDDRWLADKLPLIVPPTATKSGFYANQALRVQWTRARDALRDAEEVVLVGYSVPVTDLLVRALLTTSLQPDQTVIPVNTSADVVGQLRDVMPPGDPDQLRTEFVGMPDAVKRYVRFFCS